MTDIACPDCGAVRVVPQNRVWIEEGAPCNPCMAKARAADPRLKRLERRDARRAAVARVRGAVWRAVTWPIGTAIFYALCVGPAMLVAWGVAHAVGANQYLTELLMVLTGVVGCAHVFFDEYDRKADAADRERQEKAACDRWYRGDYD